MIYRSARPNNGNPNHTLTLCDYRQNLMVSSVPLSHRFTEFLRKPVE